MNKQLKVMGSFIFCGSATIGVMNNGVVPEQVLEISDGMLQDNAKHFIHNYPDIPVIPPTVWENEDYLAELKAKEYDLLYANPPCSGLSLGVRGPQSHEKGPNCHQYRYMEMIKKIQPKAFMYENAPTLITTGKPILNDFVKYLDEYNFTVIREFGMYHNVAMKRQRTFFIGWRKDAFPFIPTLNMGKTEVPTTVREIIGDLFDKPLGSFLNHDLIPQRPYQDVEQFFEDVPFTEGGHKTVNWVICNDYKKYESRLSEKTKKALKTQLYKQNEGLGYWDKSAQRPNPDKQAPSITGYSSFIHPIHNRQFTIREYGRLMGYPDTFEFLPDKEIVRHIAQGVPAKYFEWASGEVMAALRGERECKDPYKGTSRVVFQHHTKETGTSFTTEEFLTSLKIAEVKEKKWNLEV